MVVHLLRPLIAADGYFFCLETKEAKVQVTLEGFFAARGHCPAKSGSTTGYLYFAPLPAVAFASAKSNMPLPSHGPNCAARLSAEAAEDDERRRFIVIAALGVYFS